MTGVQSYSTTPSENTNANTGITWDEGMASANVNNSSRQNMTDLRLALNDVMWFQYGSGSKAPAPVYSSGTVFTQANASTLSAIYHVGRRIKAIGSGTGTIFGTISVTAFATSTQTVTVVWDSGSLSNEALTIYISQAPVTGKPIPGSGISGSDSGTWSPTDQSGASLPLSSVEGFYRRLGDLVYVWGAVTYPVTADTNTAILSLPIVAANFGATGQKTLMVTASSNSAALRGNVTKNAATFALMGPTGSLQNNASVGNGTVYFAGIYAAA